MTKTNAKELVDWFDQHRDVILAYVNGEEIEFCSRRYNSSWKGTENPDFYAHNDYRVKPKSKYKPFTKDTFNVHKDRWLKYNEVIHRVNSIYITGVLLSSGLVHSWGDLLTNFTFEDGTPCGEKE